MLVDTNVIVDVIGNDSQWFNWSDAQLRRAIAVGELDINLVIFAEISVRFPTLEETERLPIQPAGRQA